MGHEHIPLDFDRREASDMEGRANAYFALADKRRTVREFSPEPVPLAVMKRVIAAASTAPSGAHKQPWTFCLVGNAALKRRIREAAEKEEQANYNGRMSEEWLRDLAPFGTDEHKPFLEVAPWLVVVFKRAFEFDEEGAKHPNYYVNESVGIATGMLLSAAHYAGLATLTHTPSPMNFLAEVLGRPANERPFLLIPMGYPAPGCTVPRLVRKPLDRVLVPYL